MSYNGRGGYQKRYYPKAKPASAPVERKRIANPSEYQVAIFSAIREAGEKVLHNFRNGIREVVGLHIEAKAGTGKTTTSVEKDYYLPAEIRNDSIQVAFNAAIAAELKERVASGVEAKTLHSLGRAALMAAFPNLARVQVDYNKYSGYVSAELGHETETQEARQGLVSLLDKARDCCAYTAADMKPLLGRFDIQTGHLTENEFLSLAEKILRFGLNDTRRYDFSDMIFFLLLLNVYLYLQILVQVILDEVDFLGILVL